MIEVSHLTKTYEGESAIRDVSFTVGDGSICGLLGPNGAGKSTTMNIMTGCLAATSGEVRYDGLEIYGDMMEAKREIGYLPELPPLYPEMTPREYLTFVGRAKGLGSAETRRCVEDLAGRCGVSDVADRLIKNLSKGYRQRVGLAEALMGDPRYIILDEPTAGLDPVQVVEVRTLVRQLAHGHTVLISSHILSEIELVCDHIVMIARGRVVASGTPAELEGSGSPSATAALVAETDARGLLDALAAVEAISDIHIDGEEEGGFVRATITIDAKNEPRDLIGRALFSHGIYLREIEASRTSLESVFLELVEESGVDQRTGDSASCDDTGPLPDGLAELVAAARAKKSVEPEDLEEVSDDAGDLQA